MPYLEWTDDLSVQVKEIDDQHKKMIDCINRLHEAMLENRGRELQKEIINEMYDYAHGHFALEEKYMRLCNYDGVAVHVAEHEDFTREAAELKARADRGGLVLTAMILNFLKDWLRNHILGTDMKYVEQFRRHGLV
jgi:hemerythrin